MILVARNEQLPQCDVEVWLKPCLVLTKKDGMRLIANAITIVFLASMNMSSSVKSSMSYPLAPR